MCPEFKQPVYSVVLIILSAAVLALSACNTLQEDFLVDAAGDMQFRELDEIETSLVNLRYRIAGNGGRIDASIASDLADIQELGDTLAAEASLNRQYLARLEALRGIEAYLSTEYRRASRQLEASLEAWELDETAMVLEAFLLEDAEERLLFLDSRIIPGEDLYRLEAEKASTLFVLGRYGEAVSVWDAVLPNLPEAYGILFSGDRNKAWALKDSDTSLDGQSALLITDGPISVGAMVEVTRLESGLLDGIDSGRDLEGPDLFDFLKENEYLAGSSREDSRARRRDVAIFLWSLLADKLGDPEMLNRYSSRFGDRSSPIPDLKVDDPWFDGALGCVQTEIMSLPDGENFFPDESAIGLDFIGWLEAAENY